MIIKIDFDTNKNAVHTRIIECDDVHIETKDNGVEMVCHKGDNDLTNPIVIHLEKYKRIDHVYLIDNGHTITIW
jgi:hypothetical protein